MQKNLLLITILILFSYSSSGADSLPPLPAPEASVITESPPATTDISTWQKIKNFFGMGDKKSLEESSKEKSVNENDLKIDTTEHTSPSDISTLSAKNLEEDKDLQDVDKKLDFSDDFFKDVEKHLQEEDTVIAPGTGAAESVGSHNDLNSTNKLNQASADIPIDSAIKHSESAVNQEIDKSAKAISIPAISKPAEEVAELVESKEEVQKEQNAKASEPKPITDSKSFAVFRFKEEIERRNAKKVDDLPIIPEKDLTYNADQALNNVLAADTKQLRFIADEAKVLIIPNDDVVLGELTENAALELMDFSSYVQMFWQDYERSKRSEERQVISDFIDNYDDNFNKVKWPLSSDDPYERLREAFAIISKQDSNKLVTMLNNYPILEVRDKGQNSMLHKAAYVGNYPAAKLLIMKGISLNDVNIEDETPLSIADKYNNPYVAYLLKEAGAMPLSKLK